MEEVGNETTAKGWFADGMLPEILLANEHIAWQCQVSASSTLEDARPELMNQAIPQ